MNETQEILNWFGKAKPNPTLKDLSVQIGCHFEEIAEMLEALNENEAAKAMHALGDKYKTGKADMGILQALFHYSDRRASIADSLFDQNVTGTGIGYMLGIDVPGGLREVIRSNNSKFEDDKPVFDENGKIKQGKDYSPPDLEPYLSIQ